jgi:hypothetical protein
VREGKDLLVVGRGTAGRSEPLTRSSNRRDLDSSRNLLKLPDLLRHFPAWLEGNNELPRNYNRLARPRVPCLSRLPFLNLEHPEIAEFNPAFLHQRFDEAIKNPLDDFLNFRSRQAHFFRYRFDKFLLGHERAPKKLCVELANQGFILRFAPAREE